MKLNEIARPAGNKKAKPRVGRGPGTGNGKTAGKGAGKTAGKAEAKAAAKTKGGPKRAAGGRFGSRAPSMNRPSSSRVASTNTWSLRRRLLTSQMNCSRSAGTSGSWPGAGLLTASDPPTIRFRGPAGVPAGTSTSRSGSISTVGSSSNSLTSMRVISVMS